MAMIISKNGKCMQKIDKSNFINEDYMQEYIQNNPDAIPVYEIQKDKKLFVAKRELKTNSGPIDALAVDGDGDIYIVETKLQKNSDRRKVVAQALDYGAALWKHLNDFDVFIEMLSQESQKNFNLNFLEKIEDFFEMSDEQLELFMRALQNNLNNGNLKFVIVMDEMDERLKDLIIYINQNSQFDIYAVQLEYYKYQDFEIMIPKIFGVEVKKNIKSNNINKRSKEDFLREIEKKQTTQEIKNIIIKLLEIGEKLSGNIVFGSGDTLSFGYSVKLKRSNGGFISARIFRLEFNEKNEEWIISFDLEAYTNQYDLNEAEKIKNIVNDYLRELSNAGKMQDDLIENKTKGYKYNRLKCKLLDIDEVALKIIEKEIGRTTYKLLK
jgi:hypothetical protein